MKVEKYTSEYISLVKNFSCGNNVIDNFFKSDNALDIGQGITYILLSDDDALIGFYNIEAGRIDYIEEIAGQLIYRPMGGSANINFLAIDEKFQKTEIAKIDDKKIYFGDYLLNDCEKRINEIRNQIGISFITLNSTEEGHYLYKE